MLNFHQSERIFSLLWNFVFVGTALWNIFEVDFYDCVPKMHLLIGKCFIPQLGTRLKFDIFSSLPGFMIHDVPAYL